MNVLVSKLQYFAVAIPAESVPALLQSADRGLRLAGMARMFVYQDQGSLENLVSCLTGTEDTPFGQYYCLRSIEVTLRAANRRPILESIAARLRSFAPKLTPNSDRANILAGILSEFGSAPVVA
jgi:hypothetical protein